MTGAGRKRLEIDFQHHRKGRREGGKGASQQREYRCFQGGQTRGKDIRCEALESAGGGGFQKEQAHLLGEKRVP